MNYVAWAVALYGLYRFGKWCWIKYIQWIYGERFLRELGQEMRRDPEPWRKLGVKGL